MAEFQKHMHTSAAVNNGLHGIQCKVHEHAKEEGGTVLG